MIFGDRFMSKLDECIHVLLAVFIADVYEMQKLELIDNYGEDIIEQAYSVIVSDYSQIINRLK